MSAKRVIPCLDMKDGRVVKGTRFVALRDAGDPVECAQLYEKMGADELVLLDIMATTEGRGTMLEWVKKVSGSISIPFAVGGGIRSVEDFAEILQAGASKVGINTAAVLEPELIREAAQKFGSQRVVLALDAQRINGTESGGVKPNLPLMPPECLLDESSKYEVCINGGQKQTGVDALRWAQYCEKLGVGEILLTSVDCDGEKDGYDIEMTRAVSEAVSVAVIASGGAGKLSHFYEAVTEGKADAVLAASLFHFGELTVGQVKEYLNERGIECK